MSSTTSRWRAPAALIALSLMPAIAGVARLVQLGAGADVTPENARFFASPIPVVLHIPFALLFALLGAFQFSADFRRRHRAWHRRAGKLLLVSALVVASSGLWMTLIYPWPANDGVAVFAERLAMGIAMLLSTVRGMEAIRRRDFALHGEWMIRSYAIGMGAGTQVLTHLPWFILVDTSPPETPRAIMMGLGWAINILVAEWIIRRPRTRRRPGRSSVTSVTAPARSI